MTRKLLSKFWKNGMNVQTFKKDLDKVAFCHQICLTCTVKSVLAKEGQLMELI